MKLYCLIFSTMVRDGSEDIVPRPKFTREVLLVGGQEECENKLEEWALLPKFKSSEHIEVDLFMQPYKGQKNTTSARPNNGLRRVK